MRVVAFVAREHGLNGLQALLSSPDYEVIAIATHRRLPKSEDPDRSERSDYRLFAELASSHQIPLYTVDSSEEQHALEAIVLELEFDILASISWRRIIPLNIIQKARVGGINLHRGRLPDYPGAEPIKQALLKGDKTITITAHLLDEIIDHGKTIAVYEHPVAYQGEHTLEENIARLKHELTPHFGPLLLEAILKVSPLSH